MEAKIGFVSEKLILCSEFVNDRVTLGMRWPLLSGGGGGLEGVKKFVEHFCSFPCVGAQNRSRIYQLKSIHLGQFPSFLEYLLVMQLTSKCVVEI